MPSPSTTGAPASSPDAPDPFNRQDAGNGHPELDLVALAKKIYALFKQDARWERERRGRNRAQ